MADFGPGVGVAFLDDLASQCWIGHGDIKIETGLSGGYRIATVQRAEQ